MHTDSVMISIIIDALENRVVRVYNVKGAYLKALQVKIICEINSEYTKYIIKEKRRKVLYLTLNKVLYGCVQSTWL